MYTASHIVLTAAMGAMPATDILTRVPTTIIILITAPTTTFMVGGVGVVQAGEADIVIIPATTAIIIIIITTAIIIEKGGAEMFMAILAFSFFLFAGCAPYVQPGVFSQQVAGRTLGGAAVGAAAGTVGGATVGQPAAGAAAGAAAGGLLGLLSSLFQIHVVDTGGAPYGGGYSAPSYGGRIYAPEDYCGSFENPAEREKCEVEFKKGAEEKRRRLERQVERDAYRVAREQVRYSGTIPEEYCTNLYSEAWRQDACRRGLEKGAQTGYRQRENDIKDQAREAGYSATW